jgi:hypothetical protein
MYSNVVGKFCKFLVAISIDSANIAIEKVPGGAFSNAWGVEGGELGQSSGRALRSRSIRCPKDGSGFGPKCPASRGQGHLRVLRSKVQRRRGTPATNHVLWSVPPYARGRNARSSLHVRANLVARGSMAMIVDPLAEPASDGRGSLRVLARPHSGSQSVTRSQGGCRAVGCSWSHPRRRAEQPSPVEGRRAARQVRGDTRPAAQRLRHRRLRSTGGSRGHQSPKVGDSAGTGLSRPSKRFYFHKT